MVFEDDTESVSESAVLLQNGIVVSMPTGPVSG